MSYAHQRLIVHRDLKPGNVLVAADGRARLLDFGLARALDPEAGDYTQTAVPAMTPAYASPEQIRGEPDTVAGDVYSLGVLLYEMIAGRRPYRGGATLPELARAIVEDDPIPLTQAVPPPSAVASPATSRRSPPRPSRSGRPTVTPRSRTSPPDVRRHLDGRPVKARPATLRYRAGKLLRRHRVAIPAAALALILILGRPGPPSGSAARRAALPAGPRPRALRPVRASRCHRAPPRGRLSPGELLVRRALEYLENLSREAGRNAGMAREVALGYERVGIVQGYVGEPTSATFEPRSKVSAAPRRS